MALDDLYAIAVIAVLLVFSVGITLFAQRRKSLLGVEEGPAGSPCPSSIGAEDVTTGKTVLEVTFSESGRQHTWDPAQESLLAFAESQGIDVDSLCRAGECGTCRTKLISGEVEYFQKPSVKPGRGYCLLCVSIPKSDVTLAK